MSVTFLDDYQFQDATRRMLVAEEGLRDKPYKDTAGKLTIGVGRNLDDVGLNEDEIRVLLDNDIKRAIESVRRIYGAIFFDSISPVRQLALINMAFNLGEKGLSKFTSTNTLIKHRRWLDAANRLKNSTLYGKQLPKRVERICKMLINDEFPYG